MTQAAPTPDLATRLRDVHVDLREDLEVSRHLSRGEPFYILHDPVSFQSHRFSQADYRILVSISRHRSLGTTFDELVASGALCKEREQEFYEFVLLLHRNGFLSLPIADGALLYRRYKAARATARKRLWLSFVYFDIPLWNPDAFLNRTIGPMRPLFTWPAFAAWLILVTAALYVGLMRRAELMQPLSSLLATQNLLIMWFTLAGLKLIHELGHAYACKVRNLRVPTLGIYLVAGVPCAYVDASASWSLPSTRQRIVICLAGMYFESIVAAVLMFVWAASPPGLLNAVAYNAMFLAGVATVVFNINPLMKYDGYFVLCDLIQIPNLGQRAREAVADLAKRHALRLPASRKPAAGAERVALLSYGLAAPVYRTFVLLAVTVVLASRFYTLGLILGISYLGYIVSSQCMGLARYLWRSEETAPVRPRAVALGMLVLFFIPGLFAVLPIRSSVQLPGVAYAGAESVLRAASPGFLTGVAVQAGQRVQAGTPLAVLENDRLAERLAEADAKLNAARVRREAYRFKRPAEAVAEDARVAAGELAVRERTRRIQDLTVRAQQDGTVCSSLGPLDLGRFVAQGGEVATMVSGPPELRILLTAEELTATQVRQGQRVECRLLSQPATMLMGTVTAVSPAGKRTVALQALTHAAGGDIVVRPETGEAEQPYFQVTIGLSPQPAVEIIHGMKAVASLPTRYEPMALHVYRRLARFVDALRKS